MNVITKRESNVAQIIYKLFDKYQPVNIIQKVEKPKFPFPEKLDTPNYGAFMVVKHKNKKLFIKPNKNTEKWGIPGGTQEPNEDVFQTLHRELYEEVGLEVEVDDLLFIERIEFDFPGKEKRLPFLNIFFSGCLTKDNKDKSIEDVDVKIQPEEVLDYRWFSEIPDKIASKKILKKSLN